MKVAHLTSSRFFGGPEHQMLGLAETLADRVDTVFMSFFEEGLNRPFLERAKQLGFNAVSLINDTPHLFAARGEIVGLLHALKVDILICHGYKAGLVGWFAARKARIPAIAVSRGWTGENLKVRIYEQIDRWMLKRMRRVVCVSHAQANRVESAGVRRENITVIWNSISPNRFRNPIPEFRDKLLTFFPTATRSEIQFVIGAAGRLSPEKGFDVLIKAIEVVIKRRNDVGLIIFGEGVLRKSLADQITKLGIHDRCILAGFVGDIDKFMPHFNMFVQSSRTEGLPNVLLEALAASVPIVATNVGGTAEILANGEHGKLVGANDVGQLAGAILTLMSHPEDLKTLPRGGLKWVNQRFTFDHQADAYARLFQTLACTPHDVEIVIADTA